jgi:DNA-binding PadR family transcriptional regulator
MSRTPKRSSLGLLVLYLLWERPLHPYRMQKLIHAFGKERVVNVRARASLYQTIERLLRLGLVEVHETVRDAGHPERVVYAITPDGRATAQEWLRESLAGTGEEFPEFVAAVSILFGLEPDDARRQLERRAERLAAELAGAEAALAADVPRLFLLEEEYRRAVVSAELDWVRGVIADLRAGRLAWTEEWLHGLAAGAAPPDDAEETG